LFSDKTFCFSIRNHLISDGGYEGDMIFPAGFDPKQAKDDRALAIAGPHAWPDNVIPYDLSGIGCKSLFSS